MIYRNALTAVVLATTCLTPLAAFADDAATAAGNAPPNEVGLGLMGVVGKNPDQAGRYNGLTTTGIDIVGQFGLYGRPVIWNPDGTWYYDITGENLVLQTGTGLGSGVSGDASYISRTNNQAANNGTVRVNFGKQGTWDGGLYYDAISYTGNVIDSLYTVNGGLASLNSGLVSWGGATAGAATAHTKAFYTIPKLTATDAMLPVQTGTRRDILGGNFNYIAGDWTFTGALRHEHKEGSMEEAFDGPWGGTAFAMPIDYTTDRYDAKLAYTTRLNQASLQYTFSHFEDGNRFVNLPYPFSATVKPFQLSAAYSTPPSTDAHYITLLAATNMVPDTRINLNVRGGLELQDDMFAPDTADPNIGAAIGKLNSRLQGTTANSLNDVATVFQGKVSVESNPIANTDVSAYYGFDSRNVRLDQYKVYTGGTGGASDASFTNPQFVVPQNWFKQNAGVEVAYRIIPESDTKLTVGYRFDAVDRSNAQVGRSITNTGSAVLSSMIGLQVVSRLSYEHGDRSGVLNYVTPWANLGGTSPSTTAPTYSGAFYQAPMTSDTVKLMADYTPAGNLSGGLFAQFRNENFTYPAAPATGGGVPPLIGVGTGIKQDYNLTVGPYVDYRPSEAVNLHFFYTYEQIFFNNLGNGACSTSAAPPLCTGSAGYFQNKYTSGVHTAGVSGDWKVTDNLKLGAGYTFAYGSVMFGEFNGVFVKTPTLSYQNVSNYPDINSVMNELKLSATYELRPGVDLLLQGTWTYFHNNDWNDTAGPIQGAGSSAVSILTPGYGAPRYSIATVMAGMKYRF